MENQFEDQELQQNPEGEGTPKTPTLTEEEIAELKRRAEVSSQNFERAKKAELELKELKLQSQQKPAPFTDDDFSDEGRALKAEIASLKEDLSSFKKSKEEEAIYTKYPQLKEKSSDFKEYLEDPENKGISTDRLAKLFMVENSMIDTDTPKRKGLERPTSGAKETIKKGFTEEDVKHLRDTQPRKYEQMLRNGQLNPDNIITN